MCPGDSMILESFAARIASLTLTLRTPTPPNPMTSVVGTAVPAKPTFGLVHISAQRHHRAGQCERAVTAVWRGEYDGMTIYGWVNKTTKEIESAWAK